MERKIELQEQPSQMVLGKRFSTSIARVAEDIGAGYGELFTYLGELGEQPSGAPFALYYGPDFDPEDFEMELCVPVNRMIESRGDLVSHEVPSGQAAVTIHKGPYSEMEPVYKDLDAWLKENGYRYAGPAREVYLNDPDQVAESDLLTEVSIPIAKA